MYHILIIQQLIASTTHIVSKDLTASLSPEIILFIRAGIACFVFGAWIFYKRKQNIPFDWKDLGLLAILGFLNIPGNQYVFFMAIQRTAAPNVALAYALSPAFVLIIAILFLNEKASPLKIGGVALAVAGTILVLLERGIEISGDFFLGNLLALLASFSWALYTVVGKHFSLKYGAIKATGLTMFAGYIQFIPIFLLFGNPAEISNISQFHWAELFYLSIGTSVLGYVLWFYALKKIEASKVSVFNNLQPVFTTIMAMIFFGHELTLTFVAGGILIIMGVISAQRG